MGDLNAEHRFFAAIGADRARRQGDRIEDVGQGYGEMDCYV
ncbi:hypothetical protein [Pseudomonas fragi]|nr:hypothetical protein [Pseudomonas fragi]